jgi:glycosyltransferase involved in cell wall biosynthesis
MLLSVIICTRNRPQSLEQTLQSIAESARECDKNSFEVLVVNNGDSLETKDIKNNFSSDLPLRFANESRPGLSFARNSGLAIAKGEWILWTDDDVTVDKLWLKAYISAITRFPDVSVMGGPITPSFSEPPPRWLITGQPHIRIAFASRTDEDVSEVFQKEEPAPFGANFAIRRSVALKFPFDTKLGRHPKWPTRGGEESTVIQSILSAGGTGRWLRDAKVIHRIDEARQTKKYVRSFFFDVGFSDVMRNSQKKSRGQKLGDLAIALYRAAGNEMRFVISTINPAHPNLALHLREAATNWGAVKALFSLIVSNQQR